ncbi:MAG: murein biosynthesis integral membrane protein MurJ [Paracoccaceae bacterium]
MNARPIRLLAAFATVGGWTVASRILGFLRDIAIAAALGAGPVAEAFFVAFRLPNMFRRLFAEGAFNIAFVPLFTKRLEGAGPGPARAFAEEAAAGLAAVLFALTILAEIAMPWLVLALASGFADDPERFELAVAFGRICFPYIVFIAMAALFAGVLNAHGRFAAAAAAPVLLNVVLIGALGLAWTFGIAPGWALAWGVFAGGLAQLGLLVFAVWRIGFPLAPRRPRWSPDMRRLALLALPAALAGGVVQINLVVGTQVARYFDGAVGWLWFADRLMQLPLGVVGIAIGVVLLPELSRRLRIGDRAGARGATNRALEFAAALTLPAAVALLVIPDLIIRVLFERGAFSPEDTAATAAALAVYALGLPSFVLQKILQPAYFAAENTRAPLNFALVGMGVNALAAIGLVPVAGFLAAAWGSTLSGWTMAALLWAFAPRTRADLALEPATARRLPRQALAAVLMGAIVATLAPLAEAVLPAGLALGLTITVGVAVYAGVSLALGAITAAELRSGLRRSRAKDAA